ncbi:uncharacterized transporter HI_0883 [Parachlamydia acanthamoebae UV-7]|uniref:Uncharacterized transporter HI_0883 n=3 Tax=Parachlamydia acanthamoebae TaxID=83552 RepID=F8KWZ6_PARAV|nr:amino acid carrier protein [Parachlamydia acanthamoebae]CCB86855.1 uncharacterized transporter HI_0883 [Parachlamydia acanthamoebae UV-7]
MEFMAPILKFLVSTEDFLWSYISAPLVLLLGFFLTFQSNFVQIRKFPSAIYTLVSFLKDTSSHENGGVHPVKVFFACVGGCVGIGNIVSICTAVQIGGPGAIFWIWLTAIGGMVIKYAEVYLGLRYRIANANGSFDGGPMYFLTRAFKQKWIPTFVAFLLCLYCVEIWQFKVITTSVSSNFPISEPVVVFILIALIVFATSGGVGRVGNISSAVIPIFIVLYVTMGCWILMQNLSVLPALFHEVITSAFSGHAATGGFIGSTMMLTASQGIRRGCYTGDVGIGYASVIHSETSVKIPEKQACLVFMDIFLDSFVVCTTTILLTLITGVWNQPLDCSLLVQRALEGYFPFMNFFMPFFLFLLGYSTINAFFCVGLKCAQFLHPTKGRPLFYVYAVSALILFALVDSTAAQSVMTIMGGILLVINVIGIFKLRKEISFEIDSIKEECELSLV